MKPVREITAEEENFRLESKGPFGFIRRDSVQPVPIGTIVLKPFRITGYDKDCDGSLMARLENIDKDGEATGWTENHIGLSPDTTLVVEQEELKSLFEG